MFRHCEAMAKSLGLLRNDILYLIMPTYLTQIIKLNEVVTNPVGLQNRA
ncbi:hypothetical protein [Nostoc sp.]